MKALAIILVGLALAGCESWGKAAEPPTLTTVVTPEPTRLEAPAECSTTGDPKWKNVDDADVPRSAAARNYKANKEKFNQLAGKRAVCGDALKAHGLL